LDASAVTDENPFLVFDDTHNIWKTTSDTPLYENALSTSITDEDIDGQARPTISNPGADHYSLESVRYLPLTPADVGPNADGDINTSTASTNAISDALLYPIPTNNILHVSNLDSKTNLVEVLNIAGQTLLSYSIKNNESDLTIDTSKLSDGVYLVRLSSDGNRRETRKILIQH